MGATTKIDWCDATWNPVSGCWHGCAYCYAAKIAKRFSGADIFDGCGLVTYTEDGERAIHTLRQPARHHDGSQAAFPFAFEPTMYEYRLDAVRDWKSKTIFVCSMADLFGNWVPDEWIEKVFDACGAAPQHRYMFLTKNPERYIRLAEKDKLPVRDNMWYGTSVEFDDQPYFFSDRINTFLSIEPIMRPFGWSKNRIHTLTRLVIVGAETGNRKGRAIPTKEWVKGIVESCEYHKVPLFMKESLRGIMGEDFRQTLPWR